VVLVYAGSLAEYHLPDAVARVGALAREHTDAAHLLWVTPDVDAAHRVSRQVGLTPDGFTCLEADHDEIPGLLNAADFGLLLRRRDPVNRAASPTKAAEYLACGLPLLCSAGIGDTSALVRSESLGVVIEDAADLAELRAGVGRLLVAPTDRKRVGEVARERLARDRFLSVYRDVYGDLARRAST
jgi:glycosyltransferase involved in cell wall biosynthesis